MESQPSRKWISPKHARRRWTLSVGTAPWRWIMATPATVRITGPNTAELTKDGKKLLLWVQEPARVVMKTWPIAPPYDYESPNPGTTMVGFEAQLPASAKTVLTVQQLPEMAQKQTPQKSMPLAQWPQRTAGSTGK